MNKAGKIYKIVPKDLWDEQTRDGWFRGASIDLKDGFIHFSTAEQVRETASKHFAEQDNLLIITIDETLLGSDLKYEVSRGGALFPHLYADLPMNAVLSVQDLPLDASGQHIFPETI